MDADRPHLIVEPSRVRRNILRMLAKAEEAGALFRPHFKSHNSHAIGRLYRDCGVERITVSSVEMAEHFARDGWDDITIAFPVNPRALNRLQALARRCRVGVLVDSDATCDQLAAAALPDVRVWIDVDTGYHRTGIAVSDADGILRLAAAIAAAPDLELAGLLSHAGQTYAATSRGEVDAIWRTSVAGLRARVDDLRAAGLDQVAISVGDSPSCGILEDLAGPDEIRPGAFVFNDLQQLRLGSCAPEDLALVAACPVVATYPARGELVIHGGAVHLSKDHALDPEGRPIFGAVMDVRDGWSLIDRSEARVVSVSQEHGVVRGSARVLRQYAVGELLHVVPAHACLTANALAPLSNDSLDTTQETP